MQGPLKALSPGIKMDSFHSARVFYPEYGGEGGYAISLGVYGQRIWQPRKLYDLSIAVFLPLNVKVHLRDCLKRRSGLPLSG